jgi:hypothetical protein
MNFRWSSARPKLILVVDKLIPTSLLFSPGSLKITLYIHVRMDAVVEPCARQGRHGITPMKACLSYDCSQI